MEYRTKATTLLASALSLGFMAFVVMIGGMSAARADDLFAMTVRSALDTLLRGTGMEFSRVGDETAAIRSASNKSPASGAARADSSAAVAKSGASADPSMPSETPAATITVPAPPSDEELAGTSLNDFVAHHATTHYVNSVTTGNLTRWRGGLQSICPITEGLSPGYNAFVTARIRALAAYVGAPVHSDPQCKSNVQILFTNKPQEKMDAVVKWATGPAFKSRYSGGGRELLAFTPDHAVQGWYLTTGGGSAVMNTDVALVGLNVWPIWPRVTQNYSSVSSTGTRLGGGSGSGGGIGIVILVIDQTKVVGSAIGEIADYLAMLTLSVAQSPEHCDPLPSILDLMSMSCGTRPKPTGITAGDLAFLKSLYYRNTGVGASPSRADISAGMMQQFKSR